MHFRKIEAKGAMKFEGDDIPPTHAFSITLSSENGHQQLSAIVPAAASDNSPTVGDSTADTQT